MLFFHSNLQKYLTRTTGPRNRASLDIYARFVILILVLVQHFFNLESMTFHQQLNVSADPYICVSRSWLQEDFAQTISGPKRKVPP